MMNIQITQPEIETIIQQRLQSGIVREAAATINIAHLLRTMSSSRFRWTRRIHPEKASRSF